MDKKAVMKMFNKKTRIGALATSNKNGDVNTAVFGSPRMIDEDTVIMAIGNGSNPLIRQTTEALSFNKWGNIEVDEQCKTSMDGVYAGGDIVLGAATVILAMGQGRIAARAMNEYLADQ